MKRFDVKALGARALGMIAPRTAAASAAHAPLANAPHPGHPISRPALSNQAHASLAAVRLLREVADYERRLRRLNTVEHDPEHAYLVEAYRRALALRRDLIAGLPRPIERTPSPWPSA